MALRTGVVGTGIVAHNNHLPALARNPRTELVAVLDTDEDAARGAARAYGTRYYTDRERFFEREALDWVHVATPIATHRSLVTHALDRGVPTTVQKPAGLTVEDVDAMIRAAEANTTPASVVHNWLHYPAVRELRRRLADRELGAVRAVEASFSGEGRPDETYQGEWVFELPGGDFEEGIAHPIYLLLALAGYPRDPQAVQVRTRLFDEYDEDVAYDGFVLQYRSERGVLAQLSCLSSSSRDQQVRVHGDDGSLTLDLPTRRIEPHAAEEGPFHFFEERLQRGLGAVRSSIAALGRNLGTEGQAGVEDRLDRHREDSADGHYHLINEAAKALAQDRQPPVELAHARWTIALVERVRQAAEAGAAEAAIEPPEAVADEAEVPR